MSVKNKKVIFRMTEEFYEENIRCPRLALGYAYDSSFLRDALLLGQRKGTGDLVSLPSKRVLENLFSEVELIRTNFEAAELRCHALEGAPDARVYHKLSSKADRILRELLRALSHKKSL